MNLKFNKNNFLYKAERKKKFISAVDKYKNKRKKETTILLSILTILSAIFIFFNSSLVKLKNINLQGNVQVEKENLLNEVGINNNVKIWEVDEDNVKDIILKKYNIVSEVNIQKEYFQTITIAIKEKKLLALEKNEDNSYSVLMSDGQIYVGKVSNSNSLPIIENFNNEEFKKNEILNNLSNLKVEVLSQISEITPDKHNKDLSIIYMRDGQKVKVTTSIFSEKLNYYFEMEKHITDKTNTTLNLVNGAYVETEKTITQKESKINNLLKNNINIKNNSTKTN
ncbi:FtsQ-type POTRA domain-containing protein [Gemella sp. zg-570]|uniref:cell division protein FtsQ/DivIB n=1 Tax=Gemella sp. zg-570 TaxID=2840371 RepID=UPI001C0BDB3A|nr:FtsQ-type POTRA domain-containing protein [Gemella sp. zg-570]QWQ39364.1 FtsQ-type POTRA domain-containing protein [Gemella sp. zg-570]